MEENAPLALMGFKKLAGEAFIEPGSLQFVHEVADGETAITEQAWMNVPGGRIGCAVKTFRPNFFSSDKALLRTFCSEAQVLRQLSHPYLVQLMGVGVYNTGSWAEVRSSVFVVEEYAGPMTLAKLLKALQLHPHESVFLYTYIDAIKWLSQVGEAIAYLHENDVVHGDIRCANIFFTDPEVHETDVRIGDLKPLREYYLGPLPPPPKRKHAQAAAAAEGAGAEAAGAGAGQVEGAATQAEADVTASVKGPGPADGPTAQGGGSQTQGQAGEAGQEVPGTPDKAEQASLQRFSLKSQQSHLSPSHLSSASSSVAGRNQMVDDVADAGSVLPVINEDPRTLARTPSDSAATASGRSTAPRPTSRRPMPLSGEAETGRSPVQSSNGAASANVVGSPATAATSRGSSVHHMPVSSKPGELCKSADPGSPEGSVHSAPDAKEADGLLAAGALTNTDIEQLRPLLEQVAMARGGPGRQKRAARASWSMGVGPTLRMGLPPLPGHTFTPSGQPQPSGAGALHLFGTQALQGMGSRAGGVGAYGEAAAASAAGPSPAPLTNPMNLGSGWAMATGRGFRHAIAPGTLAGSASFPAAGAASGGAGSADAAAAAAVAGADAQGGSAGPEAGASMGQPHALAGLAGNNKSFMKASPYSAWTQGKPASNSMLQRLSNEMAPWSPLFTPPGAHRAAHTSDGTHAAPTMWRASFHHARDFPDVWGGQDPDSQAKAKLSAELKDQVAALSMWPAPGRGKEKGSNKEGAATEGAGEGGKAVESAAASGGDTGAAGETAAAAEGAGAAAPASASNASPADAKKKKCVTFVSALPEGKLGGKDLAVVYLAPELLLHQSKTSPQASAAQPQQVAATAATKGEADAEGLQGPPAAAAAAAGEASAPVPALGGPEGGSTGSSNSSNRVRVPISKETDVFAFTKVLYQVLWRTLLEPTGPTAEAQRRAIQDYGWKVAGGFREEVPTYWPEELRRMIETGWAQDPAQRPTMASLVFGLRDLVLDPRLRKQLMEADRQHRNWVRPGQMPGEVYIPESVGCGCTIS